MTFLVFEIKHEVIFSIIEHSEESERNQKAPKRLYVCLKPGGYAALSSRRNSKIEQGIRCMFT
jgi:hypothetical protein